MNLYTYIERYWKSISLQKSKRQYKIIYTHVDLWMETYFSKTFVPNQNYFILVFLFFKLNMKWTYNSNCDNVCNSEDEFITSVVEFTVEKIQNNRHSEAVRRLLCLSQECLIERDIQTYNAVTLRPLTDVTALIRIDTNTQLFTIEYADGNSRTYLTTNRYRANH